MVAIGIALLAGLLGADRSSPGPWPQFRGPNATGRAAPAAHLPANLFRPEHLAWKTPLPPGHSSPVLAGDHTICVTAVRDKRTLLTIALDARTGSLLWEQEAPHQRLEEIHSIGSLAQPSPATDGERIVSFFGSAGLFCYSLDGKCLWQLPLGPFKNNFGAGSSPIMIGDWVILNQDHDTDSFLAAIDKRTGKFVWKTDRSEFPRGYASPVLWNNAGRRQVVVVGTLRAVGYDLETGKEAWTVRGLARISNMTPVVGSDGILYIAAWAPGGDANDRIKPEPFAELLASRDANHNGMLEANEIPAGELRNRFNQIDRDKDGHITAAEYESMRRIFETAQNVMVAIRPGGAGDITQSHVLWQQSRFLPYVPSPVYHNGVLFTVKNGGIVASFDAKTGQPLKQGRVSGTANYYSSPVVADGKIFLLSERGQASVISAEPEWKELAKYNFGEDAYATPAIAGDRIYVRTMKHLYCFTAAGSRRVSTRGTVVPSTVGRLPPIDFRAHLCSSTRVPWRWVSSKNVGRSVMIACSRSWSLAVATVACLRMAVPMARTSTKPRPIS